MNKKFTLIFLVVLGFGNLISQIYYSFPSDSAYWNVGLSCQVPFCPPNAMVQPYQTSQNADTILNGIVYHKLYDKTSGNTLHSFYREANKRIYSKYPLGTIFGNDTSEFILYDFNMVIGDSFVVKVPSSWIGSGPLSKQPVIYLTSTGTISVNSIAHKTYYFSYNNCTPCPINIQWIEGVGSSSGLFYNLNYKPWGSCLSYPAPYNIYLLCFGRNYYTYPYTSGGCVLSINENGILQESKIYPNPFTDFITIGNLTEKNDMTVEIISLIGQKQNFIMEKQKSSIIVYTKEIPFGVYFLQIRSKEGFYSEKLLKIE